MIVARGAYDEGYVPVCPPCRHEYGIPVRSSVLQAVRSFGGFDAVDWNNHLEETRHDAGLQH